MDMYDQQNGYPDDANAPEGAELPQNPNQRRAVGAAAVGTAALGALGYGLSRLDDTDGDSDESISDNGNGQNNGDGQNANGSGDSLAQLMPAYDPNAGAELVTPVDHRSLDDMTFEEAFAASRQAMGPGHTFTWHGGLYNTFITEELNAMSNADRMAFVDSLDLDRNSAGSGGSADEKPQMAASHHDRPQPQHHTQHAPQLANVQHDTSFEVHPIPITTVLVGSTEVVPLMGDGSNHENDLLMADHSDHRMGPDITSVDDHTYGHGDSDHEMDSHHMSDDDHNVDFAH